jgi:hypothetical protein
MPLLLYFGAHGDESLAERKASGLPFGTPLPILAQRVAKAAVKEAEETMAPRKMKGFVESRQA